MSTHKLLDPEFIDKIIFEVKSQGHFDAFRKECLADVDTQPAYQNLHSRVEDTVQRFLNRQVWTPEIKNKNRLREEMRMNIIRAGFLDNGVSRIVDQVVEQHKNLIQSKVEEILYKHVGIEKPKKGEKNNGSLEVDTTLLPTDLEQVSPDSDKKSSDSPENKEEIEEEIIEDDDDFESPAFEPIEPLKTETACQNSHNSNLSEISGLTSQDSAENKSRKSEERTITDDKDNKPDTALSQISSTQDNITDITDTPVAALTLTGISGEEAQMAIGLNDSTENENVTKNENKEEPVFQFDLNKDTIEFTGTERKSINLDDSTNSGESEKVIQPQDIQPMEVDNIYENDTDSSEMRMEIDLKDETTQETGNSSKIEESSQESLKNKERKSEKRDRSKDRKSSSKSNKSHHHRHSSSSSKSKHDDSSRHKTHSSRRKSSSSSHKKSSSDRDKSSSGRRDRKSESSKSSRSKHDEQKSSDDHHQEKSSRRRRSTDHDSNDSKDIMKVRENQNANVDCQQISTSEKSSSCKETTKNTQNEKTVKSKATVLKQTLNRSSEVLANKHKTQQQISKSKESKSSIMIKYDYLKSKDKIDVEKEGDELRGFENFTDETTDNQWFKCMQFLANNEISILSNNNYINKKQDATVNFAKKSKVKTRNTEVSDLESNVNGNEEESSVQQKSQISAQQQRYDATDLYKPKFDFRRGRRGQIVDENSGISKETAPASN